MRFTPFNSVLQMAVIVVAIVVVMPMKSFEQTDEKHRAERLWELAIQAKGGREQLHAVQNIVISGRAQNTLAWRNPLELLKTIESREETLYVFPDKSWTWEDWGDEVHLFIGMYSRARGESWTILSKDAGPKLTRTSAEWRDPEDYYLLRDQLVFLMETRWVKPVPLVVRTERMGNQVLDVVRTSVQKYLVDFYLDQRTHLPTHIAIVDPNSEFENKELYSVSLADYTEFSAIRLPQKAGHSKVSYQINVDYNPAIFERPPSIEAGPEAWHHRSRNQP